MADNCDTTAVAEASEPGPVAPDNIEMAADSGHSDPPNSKLEKSQGNLETTATTVSEQNVAAAASVTSELEPATIDTSELGPATMDTSEPEPAMMDTSEPEPATTDTSKPEPATTDTPKPEPATTDTPKPELATKDTSKHEPATRDISEPEPATLDTSEPLITNCETPIEVSQTIDTKLTEATSPVPETVVTENPGDAETINQAVAKDNSEEIEKCEAADTTCAGADHTLQLVEGSLSTTGDPENKNLQPEVAVMKMTETSDLTKEPTLTEEDKSKESLLPIEKTEPEKISSPILETEDTEMAVDEPPVASENPETVEVKSEVQETAEVEPEPTLESTNPEQDAESIVDSTTPFIKSEISEIESPDEEMAEVTPANVEVVTESQNIDGTITPTAEVAPSKDQTDGEGKDESTAKVQLEEESSMNGVQAEKPEESGSAERGDVEMDESEGDKERTVTMLDVLQEQAELEDNADAVLGASDDNNCTYTEGYIKRQALYACLTCCSDTKVDPTRRAGVCLACSLTCHEKHELVELYTKRNFRCDCGNLKFNSHPCTFTKEKTELNVDNKYNQNFDGLYCVCHRPYPDPESTVDDEMIQCVVCEDWLHTSHLEATVPANDQYSEMICKSCMDQNEFLHDYSDYSVNVEEKEIDVVNSEEKMNGIKDSPPEKAQAEDPQKSESTDVTTENVIKETAEVTSEGHSNEESTEVAVDAAFKENSSEAANDVTLNEGSDKITNDGTHKDDSTEAAIKVSKESTETIISDDSMKEVTSDDGFNKQGTEEAGEDQTIKESTEVVAEDSVKSNADKVSTNDIAEALIEGDTKKQEAMEDDSVNDATEKPTTEAIEDGLNAAENIAVSEDDSTKRIDTDKTEGSSEGAKNNLTEGNSIENKNEEATLEMPVDDSTGQDENQKPESSKSETDSSTATIKENGHEDFSNESQQENSELSSQIPQNTKSIENIGDNSVSEKVPEIESEMETTDQDIATDNADISTANGNDTPSDNISDKPGKGDAVDSPIKSDLTSDNITQENVPLLTTEEKTDEHSTPEKVEETSGTNADVEMAEDEGNNIPSETEIKADMPAPNTECTDDQAPPVKTDKLDTDVEMEDVKMVSKNTDENAPQQQEADPTNVTSTETDKEPAAEVDNAEMTAADTTPDNVYKETSLNEEVLQSESTNKRKLSTEMLEDTEKGGVKKAKLDNDANEENACKRPKSTVKKFKGATFWPCSWRKKLCSCFNCVSMYRDNAVLFLLDLEDTVSAYEDLGKEKSGTKSSQYEKGLKALSSLDRIQQINALTEYNKMKDELLNFLISFKNRQEVVKVEDIERFFADIKPKKKPDGVYFCR